jgi:hypothetical protein
LFAPVLWKGELMEEGTYTFRNGRTVRLAILNRNVIADLMKAFGEPAVPVGLDPNDPNFITILRTKYARFLEMNFRLFNYCAGWGIVDNPTEEEIALLRVCGYGSTQPNYLRAAWVMLCLLDTTADEGGREAADFVKAAMLYSFPDMADDLGGTETVDA